MTHDAHPGIEAFDLLSSFDPWAALQDGRTQLLAALDACDARSGALTLAIPEFAALGESSGTLSALLLAHAVREREHASFFRSLAPSVGSDASAAPTPGLAAVDVTVWLAVRVEVDEAHDAMLEAAANLPAERWDEVLRPPWAGADPDSLAGLLVVRAMSDGILADAIGALLAQTPQSSAPEPSAPQSSAPESSAPR